MKMLQALSKRHSAECSADAGKKIKYEIPRNVSNEDAGSCNTSVTDTAKESVSIPQGKEDTLKEKDTKNVTESSKEPATPPVTKRGISNHYFVVSIVSLKVKSRCSFFKPIFNLLK